VVDAQENPPAIISAAKLYEVQKYCSLVVAARAQSFHAWRSASKMIGVFKRRPTLRAEFSASIRSGWHPPGG
jgi:hypothetical protein